MSSAPARSAIVRATRRTRSKPARAQSQAFGGGAKQADARVVSAQWLRSCGRRERPLVGAAHREVAAAGVRAQQPRAPGSRRTTRTARLCPGSPGATRGTSTVRSSRSRSGPDSRPTRSGDLLWRASALAHRVAREPARAWIHRADQHEVRGKHGRPRGPRDRDDAFFERLAQHFQRRRRELEHFVKEQHAVMREADLARARLRSAAGERRVRDRVVRRAEGPLREEARAGRQETRPPNARRSTGATPRRSAAAGLPPCASPSSSCPRRAVRPAAGCARPPPRFRGAPRQGLTDHIGEVGAVTTARRRRRQPALDATGSDRSAPRLPRPAKRPGEAVGQNGGRLAGVRRRQQHARRRRRAGQPRQRAARRASPGCLRRATARRGRGCRRPRPPRTRPCAARMPSAIGRSNAAPALRTSAGARFTVMRCGGNSKPLFRMALRRGRGFPGRWRPAVRPSRTPAFRMTRPLPPAPDRLRPRRWRRSAAVPACAPAGARNGAPSPRRAVKGLRRTAGETLAVSAISWTRNERGICAEEEGWKAGGCGPTTGADP